MALYISLYVAFHLQVMMYLNDGHNLKLIVIKYFKFVKCSLLRPHLKILLFSISILTDNLEHFIPFTNQTPIIKPIGV